MKKFINICIVTFVVCVAVMCCFGGTEEKKGYIKYVEFNVPYEALNKAMHIDIDSYSTDTKINWIDVLAYLGAKYGGNFKNYKASDMDKIADKLKSGEKIENLTKDMKHYSYYNEAYHAVLDGFLGEKTANNTDDASPTDNINKDDSPQANSKSQNVSYGLKVYSPIAKTFPFSHYDDFGASRSYGYKRQHLGHDLMAATGTPVIAIEDGVVECMGWNQYGGWRIGIRSADKKRYYYYAHLRQNRPYHANLKEGVNVSAGDVIGYVGRTGYSASENVNGITTSHLHLGVELIFNESQKESDNEIWINMYEITKLLQSNQSEVFRVAETKEFYSQNQKVIYNIE